jgi:hypothetical protein
LSNVSIQAPIILGDKVIVGDTIEIGKADGRIVK